jgi:aminoglycoside phosphotransferase (APT) family kinase protein
VDLVRYRPGKRATLAVDVRRSSARAQRVVVKSYHDGRKAAAVAAEAVLLDLTADPSAPLRFAPMLAHLPDLSVVVQGHVSGVRLDLVVGGGPAAAAAALRRAAGALAALHRQPAISDRVRPVDEELTRFAARAARIAEVAPSSGDALLGLATRLAGTRRDVPSAEVGLVHGDCKPSQFLLRGERDVVLLDLDSCGRADPAGDVGTFLATLRQHALRRALAGGRPAPAPDGRTGAAEEFLRAYTRAVGAAPQGDLRQRIAWYEAVALERKALRCFARAPRSPLTRSLVDAGHARLDRMGVAR